MELTRDTIAPQVLGQVLLLQSSLHAAPDQRRLAELVSYALSRIEWIDSVAVYFGEKLVAQCSSGPGQNKTWPANGDELDLSSDAVSCLPVKTNKSAYGRIVLTVLDSEKWRLYLPYFENTANLVALVLENKEQESSLQGINADLETQVRERMEALHKSEEKFRSIFNNATEGIFQSTFSGRFMEVNPAMANFLGFDTPREVVETYQDLATQLYVVPEERALFLKTIRETGRVKNFETRFKKHNGEHVWVSINVHTTAGEDGQMEYMEGTVSDITERKAAEEELKINLEKYRVLFESFPLGLSVIGEDGSILEVNQESERLLGISTENHVTRGLDSPEWALVGSDGNKLAPEELPASKALTMNRIVRDEEMGVVKPDGTVSWISVTAAPIPLEGYGVVVGYNDITARREAEQQLREAKDQLEEKVRLRTEELSAVNFALQDEIAEHERTEEAIKEALQEKEVLLREIHHRVKNNMAVVSSLVSLQMSRVQDDKVREALRDTANRVKSMALIHESLYQSESLARISMQAYTKNLVDTLIHAMGKTGSGVTVDVNAPGIDLMIDQAVPFGLIINELVTNALKYAFVDGRKGMIGISACRLAGNMIELNVWDNGLGLPDGFDIKRADSLGLKIISLLAESQLDGVLRTSNENGAHFTIEWELPRYHAQEV